jgi:hypothetical protein
MSRVPVIPATSPRPSMTTVADFAVPLIHTGGGDGSRAATGEHALVPDTCRRRRKAGGLAYILQRRTATRRDRKQGPDPADERRGRHQPVTLNEAGKLCVRAVQGWGSDQMTKGLSPSPDGTLGSGQAAGTDGDHPALSLILMSSHSIQISSAGARNSSRCDVSISSFSVSP